MKRSRSEVCEVVKAMYFWGWPMAEIQAHTGLSRQGVYDALRRASEGPDRKSPQAKAGEVAT